MSADVQTAVSKQNVVLAKTVYKMKQILASSLDDPVKISVAKNRVEQARLKAERDYLRSILGNPAPEEDYTATAADRISAALTARAKANFEKKNPRSGSVNGDSSANGQVEETKPGQATLLRRMSNANDDEAKRLASIEADIKAKQDAVAKRKEELAAAQKVAEEDRRRAEAERVAKAAEAKREADAALAEAKRKQEEAKAADQSEELRLAAIRKAELDTKRAEQSVLLAKLLKEEQELERKAEAEAQKKKEHDLKLAEAKAHFEAKRAAEEREKERRRQAAVEAARLEDERRVKDEAARAVALDEENVKKAKGDDDLAEWHGTANAVSMSSEERRRQIEEAERQAILEVDSGSANNNDDAILEAMRRTNPDAYEDAIRSRQGASAAIPSRQLEAKQQLRNSMGISASRGATLGRKQSASKVALADADYLLSMIQSDVDEENELTDPNNGARYHVNTSGEKVYRLADLPSDEVDDYLSVEAVPDSPTPKGTAEWSSETLQRRQKNLSDVERRREAAEQRKKEAWARSLERNSASKSKSKKGKSKKSRSGKGKTSETQF